MKTRRKPSRFALVIVSVTSVVVTMVLAEAALRMAGVYASYSEKNNNGKYISPWKSQETGWLHTYQPNTELDIDSKEFKQHVKTNSLGLNDKEWPLQKTKPLRVACIGDSFTEGVGAPPDSSYPAQLEKLLGNSAEVMNCGVSGNDPVFGYKLYSLKLLGYKPSVVVVTINATDIFEIVYRGGFERFVKGGRVVRYRPGPWWEPYYAHCYLVRLFMHKALGYNRFLFTEKDWAVEQEKALTTLYMAMSAFQRTCEQQDSRCIFLFHPLLYEMRAGQMDCQPLLDYFSDPEKMKGFHAGLVPVETVDMLSMFKKKGVTAKNITTYYWPNDTHNTPLGYTLIATALEEKINTIY